MKSANRLSLLSLIVATVLSILPGRPLRAAQRRDATQKPNIILIMCDDLGWGDVGFNGNRTIKTPNLDTMAKSGLKFNRFYAASAVCSPTRGSVVTGRNPYRYGIPTANAGHMKAEELTVAELLRKAGYRTGHFGKWHLGTLTKTLRESNRGGPNGVKHYSPPWNNGFDVCFSTEAKVPTYDPMLKPSEKSSRQSWDFIRDRKTAVQYGTHYWNEKGQMVRDNLEGDDSKLIMDRAAPFIESAANDAKPFFAIIWFHTPHLPVVAGPKHAAMYAQHDSYRKNYYGCITAMDEQIGRLRSALRTLQIADQTMLAFCSDNGPEGNSNAPGSAGPFRGRKRDLYEGGVRVPAVIEWPARIKPGETDYPAVTSDYLPTILGILGAKLSDNRPIDGLDLAPVFQQPKQDRGKPIGFQFSGKWAWNDNQYKLVYYPKRRNRKKKAANEDRPKDNATPETIMLFDLIADPGETKNLAGEMPERVERMKRECKSWRDSCVRSAAGGDYGSTN
jgi:arylsulfatase A-like enzyme